MSNEIWKEIPDFESYEASNTGLIRKKKTSRLVKQSGSDIRNYQVVSIYFNKKKYTKKVARLVWAAFNGCHCAETIDHIDRNKLNNNIENLRCISYRENSLNRTIYNKIKNKYQLTTEDKIEIIKKYRAGEWSTWYIAKQYGIPNNYISIVIQRGTWDKLYERAKLQGISSNSTEDNQQ